MHTKEDLARRFARTPRTIDLWASQAGLPKRKRGNRRVFSDTDVAAMMAVAGIDEDATEPAAAIVIGNHQTVLPAPTLPDSYSLEAFRSVPITQFDDIDAGRLAAQKLRELTEFSRSHRQHLQAKAHEARMVADDLGSAIADADREALIYEIATAQAATEINRATEQIQRGQKKLGKYARGDSSHA